MSGLARNPLLRVASVGAVLAVAAAACSGDEQTVAQTPTPTATVAADTGGNAAPTPSLSPTATGTPTDATPAPTPLATQTATLPPLSAFQKGMTFADWSAFTGRRTGLYPAPSADESLRNLAATGANWIAVVVRCGQETVASTHIFCDSPATATDDELRRVVSVAHDMGLRVMLKPQLDFSREPDPSRFRGHIGTAFTTEAEWQDWFDSYRQFMNRYAMFAQQAGVDLLVVGVELGAQPIEKRTGGVSSMMSAVCSRDL